MSVATTQTTTFAVDDVPVGTRVLKRERLKASVERLLGTPVEACDSYAADVVKQPGFHSLIAAADLAYQHHFPLILTPRRDLADHRPGLRPARRQQRRGAACPGRSA